MQWSHVFIDAHLRLEAFESQDHLAKLIRDAGKGLGNCRKDLLSLDPSTYTLQSIGPVLDKATGPTIMFVDVFSQLLLQQPNIFFISRISVATLSYAGLKQLIRRRSSLCKRTRSTPRPQTNWSLHCSRLSSQKPTLQRDCLVNMSLSSPLQLWPFSGYIYQYMIKWH